MKRGGNYYENILPVITNLDKYLHSVILTRHKIHSVLCT